MADIDVAGAIEALLALTDRTPGFPSGDVMVHPDELLTIIGKLTAPAPVRCGCLLVDDMDGGTHTISNPCSIHRAQRPIDFYGDGFWAGYRGHDESVDPASLNPADRTEWGNGYARGLGADTAPRTH